jgi:hypothetical protein
MVLFITTAVRTSNPNLEFCSGSAVVTTAMLTEDFRGFPESLQAEYRDNTSISPRPLTFRSLPVHHPCFILPSDAM